MSDISGKKPAARFTEKCQSMERMYEEYAKSKGLTYMSMMILEIIYRHPDCCTQKLICEESKYSKQSVNAIIKTFWEQGYVDLKEERTDRRNKRILFTDAGRKYADGIIGRYLAVESEAMSHLTDKQWAQLIGMIDTFEHHFRLGITGLIQATEEK